VPLGVTGRVPPGVTDRVAPGVTSSTLQRPKPPVPLGVAGAGAAASRLAATGRDAEVAASGLAGTTGRGAAEGATATYASKRHTCWGNTDPGRGPPVPATPDDQRAELL
jgi:hypothetical protein